MLAWGQVSTFDISLRQCQMWRPDPIIKKERKIIILMKKNYSIVLIALIVLLLIASCDSIRLPAQGSIVIAGGAETTENRIPILTIQSENAAFMSFSGDGEEWTEWIPYSESYQDFDIASGEYGTQIGVGIKFVFVRFRDWEGNISTEDEVASDSIEYSPSAPGKGNIAIANGAVSTSDITPILTIQSENAAFMSFSGDGEEWTEWIPYIETYQQFNIASGEYGTVFSQGEKSVYVRFKNESGELSPSSSLAQDTILLQISDLDLKYIRVFPEEIVLKVNGSHIFVVKGVNNDREEVPIDGKRVDWYACCNAKVLPSSGSTSVQYTAPSGTGDNKFIRATYSGSQKTFTDSSWIQVVQ